MNFQQEFRRQFGEKYGALSLKSVVVRKSDTSVVVTFLYPSSVEELTDEQKKEIVAWIKNQLDLQSLTLKVKFLRVFVEERLILKTIKEFFEKKFRLISTYLSDKNFKIKITPIDVQVQIEVSTRLKALFGENDVQGELAKYLKENYLIDFVILPVENTDFVDEVNIDDVELKATYHVAKKHYVEIVKMVAGTQIPTVNIPSENDESCLLNACLVEDLSNIKQEKENVLVAGFLQKIERRDFVIKKGKRQGQQKAYFPFVLKDETGHMDGVYFCPKAYEKNMESLEEEMFVAVHGDVRINQSGKLQLVADKVAVANIVNQKEKENKPVEWTGPCVQIEKIAALEQNSMFEQKQKYNRKITGRTIVVFDCETTGLDRERDQIIELGAVKIENGNIIEKFSTFVKPTKRIPYEVSKLTGITNEMVEDAPPIELVIRDFYNFSKDCVLCGHNVIEFDIHFIKREGEAQGLVFDNEIIDTMNEARVSRLKTSRFNLGTVTKLLGISLEGAHRAWNDAYATAQVLLKLNMA